MTRQITTINPATEEVINSYEIMTKEQIREQAKLRVRFLIGKKIYSIRCHLIKLPPKVVTGY
ncbi:MAG: hypothetical protein WBF33_01910 [Candidatus Nitrosopolaris sp.]